MDSHALKAFIAVAQTRSFSRAAEQLFLTQPAVSKRISALEQELGTPLFNRIGRSIDLTPAGESLLPRAKSILDEQRLARLEIDNLSTNVRGVLNFAMSHHIGLRRMPALLREYAKQFPEVELKIAFLGSEEANILVEQGELEFALITLPEQNLSPLHHQHIWTDPLAIVTAIDSPLQLNRQRDLTRLSQMPVILPTADTVTYSIIETAFAKQGIELQVGMQTNNLETIKMMVSIGIGWSVLPLTMVDSQLLAHQAKPLTIERSLGIVQHPKRTLSNAAKAMLDMISRGP